MKIKKKPSNLEINLKALKILTILNILNRLIADL